jgi:hypothetical protein
MQPKIGQGAEMVERVTGVVVTLQSVTGPGDRASDQRMYRRVLQHRLTLSQHLRVIRRLPKQIEAGAVARPGFRGGEQEVHPMMIDKHDYDTSVQNAQVFGEK